MRLLGSLPDLKQARAFSDYLLTQRIPTKVMEESDKWDLWVQNEDQVETAKAIWAEFQRNPLDERFHQAAPTAAAIKKQEKEAERQWQLNFRTSGHLWGRPTLQQVPLTAGLIGICIVVFLLTDYGSPLSPNLRFLTYNDPHLQDQTEILKRLHIELPDPNGQANDVHEVYFYRGIEDIKHGQLWRLVTPIFIHFGFLHILFNMYALFSLGGLVEFKRGWQWMLAFVIGTAVISNTAQYFFPSAFDFGAWMGREHAPVGALFGGMSGVLYALFGFMWMKTRYDPEPGLLLPRDLILMMLGWLLLCVFGFIAHVANTAHVAGLLSGVAIGAAPTLWRELVGAKTNSRS